MRTFDLTRGETRYQGAVFEDGAISVRRLSDDPCSRITFTFEGLSECESELGIAVPPGVTVDVIRLMQSQQNRRTAYECEPFEAEE